MKSDPCRLVRPVKEIHGLDLESRCSIRPLPPCVAGESDSGAIENRAHLPRKGSVDLILLSFPELRHAETGQPGIAKILYLAT